MTTRPSRPRGRPSLEAGRSPEIKVAFAATDYAETRRLAVADRVSVGSIIRRAVRTYLHARRAPDVTTTVSPPSSSPQTPRVSRSVVVKRSGL